MRQFYYKMQQLYYKMPRLLQNTSVECRVIKNIINNKIISWGTVFILLLTYLTQQAFTGSKSTTEKLEKDVKYVQNQQ